jgi:tetratricopeptide (TPR) repeat protein
MRTITIAAVALLAVLALPALAQVEDEESEVMVEEEHIPATPDKLLRGIKHYKNKEYGLAALDLWEVVTDDYYEYYHADASYYLARSLDMMGYPYAALDEYQRFLRLGGNSDNFQKGFEHAVALADELEAGWLLADGLSYHSTDVFGREGGPKALYWVGKTLFEAERLAEARAYLQAVPRNSEYYPRAKLIEGVVLTRQFKPQEAIAPFTIAYDLSRNDADDWRVAELANLNLARTYYALKNYERAIEHYQMVPRSSLDWHESLFERAWAYYMMGRLNDCLAELESVTAPFFDEWYIPEPRLLRILVYYNLCKYDDGERMLEDFTSTHLPMQQQLLEAVRQSAENPRVLFDTMTVYIDTGERQGIPLPAPIIHLWARDESLRIAGIFVDGVEAELERLSRDATGFGTSSAGYDIRERLENRVYDIVGYHSDRVLGRLHFMERQLLDYVGQAEIYKLEMLTKKQRLFEAAASGRIQDMIRLRQRGFRQPPGYVTWPFEGEFWMDELGWYQVDTLDECKEILQRSPGG